MCKELRAAIEATRLGFGLTAREIEDLCDEAARLQVGGVCVPPVHAALARRCLKDQGPSLVSVAAFPYGDTSTAALRAEIDYLVGAGVAEIDVVAPLGHALEGDWAAYEAALLATGEAVRASGVRWKVILESAALSEEALVRAANVAVSAGADWLKTSTGFHPAGGASTDAVRMLRTCAPRDVGVKASGGIRDRPTALAMIEAGADRIGTSAARTILS